MTDLGRPFFSPLPEPLTTRNVCPYKVVSILLRDLNVIGFNWAERALQGISFIWQRVERETKEIFLPLDSLIPPWWTILSSLSSRVANWPVFKSALLDRRYIWLFSAVVEFNDGLFLLLRGVIIRVDSDGYGAWVRGTLIQVEAMQKFE